MNVALTGLLSGLVLCSVGSVVVAAPDQVTRPGEISPPNVWIQNRGPGEAIPVSLVNADQPLPVAVGNLVAARVDNVVTTRASRQAWEYTQVRIAANQDAAATLNGLGADGWEATGLQFATSGGTTVLLKRPR